MSNLALYRKYRSQDFDEVVGQSHVVDTLKNAIKSGKHSHAYLLTGPRGVGKTTVARLIAKSLNKLPKQADLADYLDIIEIDGASNRGIDEIRNLKEKIQVAPAKLEYKVYIIDEVHMLTKEAFNALLKTLEEPPSHAVFIFATTEIHKVPDTIISRTQRFDFRPIQIPDLERHLKFIAKQEKIDIEDQAIALIARLSRGGFRDAISLLDQVAAVDGKITSSTITDFTGLQDTAKLQNIISLVGSGEANSVLAELNGLYMDGADPALLTQQLLDMIHDLVNANPGDELSMLVGLSQDLGWVQANLRFTTVPQLLLQVGLVRSITSKTLSKPVDNAEPIAEAISPKQNKPHIQAVQSKRVEQAKPTEKKGTDDEMLIKSLSVIKHYNNSLYALLRGAKMQIEDNQVRVKCRFSFHRDRISEQRNMQLIEKAFSKVYDRPMQLVAEVESTQKADKINSEEELISSAMAIFGGEVVDG